jgi:hypothetical protein
MVQAGLGVKQDPISKITKTKKAGGVAHEVEACLARVKALSSNPSTTKNNNKKNPIQTNK